MTLNSCHLWLSLFIISSICLVLFLHRLNKKAWRDNPKINLDSFIKNFNDETRKQIDGEYYTEGKYWILENSYNTPIYCYSSNKSIIRFAARIFIKRGWYGCTIYSSNAPYGKLLLDRSHAKRYVFSNKIDFNHEY